MPAATETLEAVQGLTQSGYKWGFETKIENGEIYVGGALTWPGRDKILAKRQALIDAYKAQAKAREEEEAKKQAEGEANA